MGAGGGSSQNGLYAEINVTPLVDVVLVLLVIMMMAATALANKSIAVELPKASSGTTDGKKAPLIVSVDESGALYLEKQRATDLDVRRRAREANGSAVLAADARARHAAVVRVLDLLRSEQVSKVAIVVKATAP